MGTTIGSCMSMEEQAAQWRITPGVQRKSNNSNESDASYVFEKDNTGSSDEIIEAYKRLKNESEEEEMDRSLV